MLSIITPNLNDGEYLEENIRSILRLRIPFEHIIVDGGSTDDSLHIIKRFPHLKVLHQNDKTGMYGAIDFGIRQSSGQYVTWVNADDRIHTDGYQIMYTQALYKKYDFVYSGGIYHYIHQNKIVVWNARKHGRFFIKHGLFPTMQPSIIFSKVAYFNVGGFDYKNFKICGDLDLFVRIANKKSHSFKYIDAKSSTFTKRGDSLGDLNTERCWKEIQDNKLPVPNLMTKILFRLARFL